MISGRVVSWSRVHRAQVKIADDLVVDRSQWRDHWLRRRTMQRLRLKADGRIVELRDGQEFPLQPAPLSAEPSEETPAVRDLRRRAQLTQHEFAARLGVPVETIRNWEQGKRAPRGPARALLTLLAHAPEVVFATLAKP
jgi:putative transcriptional regulator